MSNHVIYIMGVSGCGKTTIGKLLHEKTSIPFYDGDDFHSKNNIKKMQTGLALKDDDRWTWLSEINKFAKEKVARQSLIIACSALKAKYREVLEKDLSGQVSWVHLENEYDTIAERIKKRKNHYMPLSLLSSQFDDLEAPDNALSISNDNIEETIHQIISILPKRELGFVGLGVMGKSLSRNLAGRGFKLSLYNRHIEGSEEKVAKKFIQKYPVLLSCLGFDDIKLFVQTLSKPRKIFLMVPAGNATDALINEISPYLNSGDILIDGGNAHYKETKRRQDELKQRNIFYIGTGVSGGEAGALNGPAIMPSGDFNAYVQVQNFLEKIAAKNSYDKPCCAFIGKGSSGHFVKMVHNGIEYGEMQLLAEVYATLRFAMQYSPDEIADILEEWRKTDLDSYLLEITIDILRTKEKDEWLLDYILDKAGNKGTGSWTTIAAGELGVPIPTMTAALYARYNSAYKNDRIKTEKHYSIPFNSFEFDLVDLQNGYRMSRIVNHHEGFQLINAASDFYGWEIDLVQVAQIWTNGCIIRSTLMNQLTKVFEKSNNIFWDEQIRGILLSNHKSLQNIISQNSHTNIPIPCFSAALQHFHTYIQGQSSANIIQAQRDFFGAHRYQRIDEDEEKTFHTDWEKGKQ